MRLRPVWEVEISVKTLNWARLRNGQAVLLAQVPVRPWPDFRAELLRAVHAKARLAALFARPVGSGRFALWAVLARDQDNHLRAAQAHIGTAYPALTPDCPQAHGFEREVAEQWGVKPEGHPWLKPIRFRGACAAGPDMRGRQACAPAVPGAVDYFQVQGQEVHEVAVGPVHAGVIEPGHFRFQCQGEQVLHLEISLGYQHRGIERALLAGKEPSRIHYFETLAGDTTIGHALAFCQAWEALAGVKVPARAQALRAVALELERLANHAGDLGALANDVGYLPTASFCGRLRGDLLNLTALACGSRFGRGWVRPGGVAFDLEPQRAALMARRLADILRDLEGAVNLLWSSASVLARFEDAGKLSRKACEDLGLVGPAARACGMEQDVRFDHPAGFYTLAHIPMSTWTSGDVLARAYVRWLEIQRSAAFIQEQLPALPTGPLLAQAGKPAAGKLAISLVEGWRGEICHVALTDDQEGLAHYKIVDPSFHNWMGLAQAMRGQQISDFPLCNKSFNLSYCGHDL